MNDKLLLKQQVISLVVGLLVVLLVSTQLLLAPKELVFDGYFAFWIALTLLFALLFGWLTFKILRAFQHLAMADMVPVSELNASIERFNRLSEHAGVLISTFDIQHREIKGNDLWAKHFGFEANVPIPFSHFELAISPDNCDIFENIYQEILVTGAPHSSVIEFYMPTGDLRVYRAQFMPVSDKNNHLHIIKSFLIDISHEREAARAVQEQMRQTERALGEKRRALANADLAAEAAGIGFATRIEHLRFQLDNNTARILGFATPLGLSIDNFEEFIESSYRLDFHRFVEKTRLSNPESIEFPIRVDGEQKWLQMSAIDHIDSMNRRTSHYSFVDVTSIKLNENRLSEALDLAESKREQAEQARATLQSLQLKQNQMFGVVAHELRTPVSAVSMILDSSDATDLTEHRGYLSQVMGDLLNTIDDMKMLVNPDIDRPIRMDSFNLKDLLNTINTSVGSTVAAANIAFNQLTDLTPQLLSAPLRTDTYRLKVAITNLIRNACLHSEGTEIELFVDLVTLEDSDSMIEIIVSDNGKGIPEADAEQLFNAGNRGETQSEGSGLGLYIASTWLAEIGGSLTFKNRDEGGAEFTIHIPLIPDDTLLDQANTQTDSSDNSSTPDRPFENLKILLVEDETVIRMMSAKVLENLGATVVQAENGQVGLDAWTQEHHLIITDYFMPEMTGAQMTKALRSKGCKSPIIAVTAATIGEQYHELLSSGVDKILSKPLNKQILIDTVNQFESDGRL